MSVFARTLKLSAVGVCSASALVLRAAPGSSRSSSEKPARPEVLDTLERATDIYYRYKYNMFAGPHDGASIKKKVLQWKGAVIEVMEDALCSYLTDRPSKCAVKGNVIGQGVYNKLVLLLEETFSNSPLAEVDTYLPRALEQVQPLAYEFARNRDGLNENPGDLVDYVFKNLTPLLAERKTSLPDPVQLPDFVTVYLPDEVEPLLKVKLEAGKPAHQNGRGKTDITIAELFEKVRALDIEAEREEAVYQFFIGGNDVTVPWNNLLKRVPWEAGHVARTIRASETYVGEYCVENRIDMSTNNEIRVDAVYRFRKVSTRTFEAVKKDLTDYFCRELPLYKRGDDGKINIYVNNWKLLESALNQMKEHHNIDEGVHLQRVVWEILDNSQPADWNAFFSEMRSRA